MMKKLYIADIRGNVINGKISGHIVPVARNYREILCCDYDVKIAAGPAILNSFTKNDVLVLPYNVCSDSFMDKMRTFVNFIVLLRKTKGSPIIVQQSTVATSLLAVILFYWWTSPLYMIQYNTKVINNLGKRLICKLAQLKITGIICPTDRIGKTFGGRYCVVPDYLFHKKHLDILPYKERKWDIGIIGGITANKGTLEAARYLANSGKKVVIAGRICEEELNEPLKNIASTCSNIEFHIDFLSDEDYLDYIRNSRFCMLNYRGTYFDRSSGVLLDVIYNGTPVVGTRCEALKMVEENTLGLLYDDLKELDIDKELILERYQTYLNNIRNFLDKQLEYNERLRSFLK